MPKNNSKFKIQNSKLEHRSREGEPASRKSPLGDLGVETRAIPGTAPEIRADSEGKPTRTVTGYALLFGVESRVMADWMDDRGFVEVIDKDALQGADLTEVIARTHHDNRYVLARTESKTLKLTVDTKGLRYEFDAPNTTAGNDLLEDIRNKNITGSSFAFNLDYEKGGDIWEDRGKDKPALRTIKHFSKISDVAPVVNPAYPQTTAEVAKRSYERQIGQQPPAPRKNNPALLRQELNLLKLKSN